jgi:hypothetical protein
MMVNVKPFECLVLYYHTQQPLSRKLWYEPQALEYRMWCLGEEKWFDISASQKALLSSVTTTTMIVTRSLQNGHL